MKDKNNGLLSKLYGRGKLYLQCGARILMYWRVYVYSNSALRVFSRFAHHREFPKKLNKSTYYWKGINHAAEKKHGLIDSNSIVAAKVALHKQGILVKKIGKKRIFFAEKKITSKDIAAFSRHLATLLEAGISVIQALDILIKNQKNDRLRNLFITIKNEIESGLSLAEALHQHQTHFNKLFCNLVEAGEKSGVLDIMLAKIAIYQEKIEGIKKKIKKTLVYPISVLIIAFLVTSALLFFVVPRFEVLFKGFGAELPLLTRSVMEVSKFFQMYWYLFFIFLYGLIMVLLVIKKHSPYVAYFFDKSLLKLPLIGGIFQKAIISRFCRTLAITFAAGLPLVDALKTVANTTGNILYTNSVYQVCNEVMSGQTLQHAIESTQLFPARVVQMITIGEESGALEAMLSKVAEFYEEEVDNSVDSLSSLFEPLVMTFLGLLIGGLVIAMYLPIFKLGSLM